MTADNCSPHEETPGIADDGRRLVGDCREKGGKRGTVCEYW